MRAHRSTRVLLAALLVAGLAALLVVSAQQTVESAGRRVGLMPDQGERGILVTAVPPGLPAERAGLRPGDELVGLGGIPIHKLTDYDVAAARFEPGRPVEMRVVRDGRELALAVVPGTPPRWRDFAINAVIALCFLGLALLALRQRELDVRGLLLLLFASSVAFEMSLPISAIGHPWIGTVSLSCYYLLTGLQIGLELHLASLIPERHGWLSRRPWIVPLYYAVGVGLGALTCATYLLEEGLGRNVFSWTSGEIEQLLLDVGLPVWAVAVAVLLAAQALRYPVPRGRHQAALVLAGVLPWLLFVIATTSFDLAGEPLPDWLTGLEPLAMLWYPAALFAAIYRYHLFDIELVVRRGLIYTTLTGSLILVFYAALGAGGALFSRFFEGGGSVWTLSAATLVLGLIASPLRRALHRVIDRRFFPERQALRQRLIALASELPALGSLQLMGRHLVARMAAIFSARRATLLIADPERRLLVVLGSTGEVDRDGTLLLTLDDPGIELLRRTRRPTSAAQVAAVGGALAHRLPELGAELLAPLLAQDRLIGLLALGGKASARRYPAEELELLSLLSHHVAIVFENARLFASATYESLTGLLRREAILEQLERELERALRYGRPLTIAMADLDHFKEVNDRYGHLAGDALLKRVSQAAAAALRSTDWIGRYGGEEFLLVLPETDIEGAAAVAEKIRRVVQAAAVPMGEDGAPARVTISIGLATLDGLLAGRATPTARDLIAAADRSLYEAKNGGRNRIFPLVA